MTRHIKKNNQAPQQVNKAVAALSLLATFVVCTYFHLNGIGGDFLSDDFVHAQWIADAQNKRGVLNWLIQLLYLPLDSGNYAYRPVVFASYALDWVIYGANAAGWHLTNLVIHLVNGVLVLLLAWRLAKRADIQDAAFVAITAASLFIAIPFAGETTFWPVGRFDLLACLFSLVFLIVLLGPATRPGILRIVASLACLLLALLSKESAMPMLAVGFMLVFAFSLADQRATSAAFGSLLLVSTKETLIRYWPVFGLALAYFAWRFLLFGSAWKVYPDSHFPANPTEFASRVVILKHVFVYPYAAHASVWWVLVTLTVTAWLVGLTAALKQASFAALVMTAVLFCCFIGYLLAPGTSFPIATINGEGIRNLYFPWAMFSLFVGFSIAHHRFRTGLLYVALIIAFWGQWRLLTLWQNTAIEMLRLTTAVPALASKIDQAQYALLLLPDHVSAVPFARNAQDVIVMPPRQTISYLPKMVAMTPLQFAAWEQHLANNIIGSLKGDGKVYDRAALSGVFCWVPSQGQFQRFNARPRPNDPVAWEAETMTEAKRIDCLL